MPVTAGAAATRPLVVRRLGRIDYEAALALQQTLVDERRAGTIPDTLLLLEHPPVITLGVRTRGKPSNVIAADDELAARGVRVFETGRGGDVTYHGPGQLIGYPIVDLRPDRCDVHQYVRDIEEVIIRAVKDLGVSAGRVTGLTGVWVGPPGRENKLAAIGVRISRWITSHGFAINASTDLRNFGLIVPCGIPDRGVTSLEQLLGRSVPLSEVESCVEAAFRTVLGHVQG